MASKLLAPSTPSAPLAPTPPDCTNPSSRQTPTTPDGDADMDHTPAIRGRVAPLVHLGDSKLLVVWPGQKRCQRPAGGGNAVLLQHPYRIPRVLGRAHVGLDGLRGQAMHQALGLLVLGDGASV